MGNAGIVVFGPFGDEAEALVEGDDVGLGGENDIGVAASPRFGDSELHDRPPHPSIAIFLKNCHPAYFHERPFVDYPGCACGQPVDDGEDVCGAIVEVVHLKIRGDRLLLDKYPHPDCAAVFEVIGCVDDAYAEGWLHV